MPDWLALFYDQPIELADGEGRHVVDGEGNRYLDFFGGILTTMTGYNVPEVVEAIQQQAAKMIHSSTLYLIRPMVELAEEISALSGLDDAKVFFTTSGTEANEAALLLTADRAPLQPGARPAQQLPRSLLRHMGVTGNRGWSASSLSPVHTSATCTAAYRFRSPFRDLDDAGVHRGVRRTTCATSSPRPPPATSPA